MRVTSGVPGFDPLVQGGIPSGGAVVIQGPAGREKDTFLFQYIAEGLRGGGSALVVLSSASPAKYLVQLREAGFEVDRILAENRLKFVDWFTYKENPVQDVEQDGAVFRASIDLANVGIAISRAIGALPREGERRAAVEVLSPALSSYELSAVYGFAQATKAKLGRSGFTSLFVLEKAMHDERATSSIHQPFDGVVDIERVREGDKLVRKMAVLSLVGTVAESTYVPLEIGGDGVLRVSAPSVRVRTPLRPEELIKSNPKDPKLWLAAAQNLYAMGENERALKCVEAALHLDASDRDALQFKAKVLDALGRKDRQPQAPPPSPTVPARKEDAGIRLLGLIEDRLRENPRDPDALFSMAAVLARVNDLLGAVTVLDKLAELDETYPGLWVLKTQLHARRGELQKAEESRARRLKIEAQERQAAELAPPPSPLRFSCPSCGLSVREEDTSCKGCGALFGGAEDMPSAPSPTTEPTDDVKPATPGRMEPLAPTPRPPAPRTKPEPEVVPVPKPRLAPAPRPKPAERGLTNTIARDSTRGLRRTAGHTNGTRTAPVGRTNGLVNGLRGQTDGLVNGLKSARSGMTNGLTNGTGFTNGLGSARLQRETVLTRWKVYVIPVVTVALLLLPILGSDSLDASGIVIDGDASDWNPSRIAHFGRSAVANPNVDIVRAGVAGSAYGLSCLIEVEGTVLEGGGSPGVTDRFHVFLDTDRDATTGYAVDSLGAETLVDVSGLGGTVQDASLYTWQSGSGTRDWRGWVRTGFVAAAASGNTLELRMDATGSAWNPSMVAAAIHGRAFDSTLDTSDSVLSAVGGSLGILQEPVVADLLPGPAAAILLRLDVTAFGGEVDLTGLDVALTGIANLTSVTAVRLVDGSGAPVDQRTPTGPKAEFRFATRTIVPSSPHLFFVVADILPSDGSTLGAIIADASNVAADGPVSVRRAPSARQVGYLSIMPMGPRVDGGFSEWTGTLADPEGDASQQEIDLTSFDARFMGTTSFFYAAVNGRILSGTWVPEANRARYLPVEPETDTDRDTVPDLVDLYPFDFNNDLVQDLDTGGDVDDDGVIDHDSVWGADWWLNTTIPASFPAPYAGRAISVFIGPWTPPFRTRDDILRVFVDLDNASGTGYAIANLGADRLVEISGTEGKVRTADYFSFGGSYPGQWSWVPLSQATVATAYDRMEFSVAENLTASGGRMFVEAQAPLGANDAMESTRGTRGTSTKSDPSENHGSSFDVAPSPILETWRASALPATTAPSTRSTSPSLPRTSVAQDPPRALDIGGNQKLYLRDTAHGTETACTTNKVASSTQGAGAVKSGTLSSGQDACWYADSTTGTTISAGDWETLLDTSISPYNAKAGVFNIGTGAAGTTVNITGVGFQPKAVILWWSGRTETADTAGTMTHQRGFGVAVSPTDRRAICSWSEDNNGAGSHDVGDAHRADAAICSMSGDQAIDGLADLKWMHSDGFTLDIDNNFATSLRIHYLALGGSTLTNVASGMFTEAASTGNQDVTSVGFQPDAVILFSAMIGADPPGTCWDAGTETTCDLMTVGFAAGSGNPNDVVWAGGSDDNAVQTISYHRATESIALMNHGATIVDGRAQVDAWLSNGFSLDWTERAGSRRIHYLALKGGSYVVGDVTTLTSTGALSAESGFGFSPKASLFVSHNKAQSSADTPQDHDELSIGAFSSTTSRGAQCVIDEDGVSPSDIGTAVEHDEVYCNLDANTAIEGLMDVDTVGTDGFTLYMDDADPSASFVGYLAFGADITYDVHLQIWDKTTNSVRATIGSCLDVTTTGDDVRCLVSGVAQQTVASDEVVRIRVLHSGSTGTVTIDYDDSDTTGDSRATIPTSGIPEFSDVALPLFAAVIIPIFRRWSRRQRGSEKRQVAAG